ncbi:hypothetical protein ASG63_16440 [Methylobacterium sp. Leaf94]|uniref:hypothetical protein n=1 Tax=Methylobacterium sp. Leaf94 TaxID=1736250 RepID=UPI0007137B06|nr:hypothetical protein [Methylobacterium sp. Leaf94]KQU31087.1 hypothetical protein ASG63_16440 [Methylobacterium sp. Leaf94]
MFNPSSLPSPASRAALRRAHLAALHPHGSVGRPFVGSKVERDGETRFEGVVGDLAECHAAVAAETTFVSLNRFWGRSRAGSNLKSVASIAVDFDYFYDGLPYAHLPAEEVADMLVEAMVASGIPRPSIDVASGRGVQMSWIGDGAKASAWARVRAIYDALHGPQLDAAGNPVRSRRHKDDEVLAAFDDRMAPLWRIFRDCGLDRSVRDAARVVRLVGSVNARSGRMARLLFPSQFQDVQRYSLHALADAILPRSRAAILALREARAAAKAEQPANDNGARKVRRVPAGYWPTVLADLLRLRAHRGGIEQGKRRTWLFLTANAHAHVHGGCPADWATQFADLAGLSEGEARECLQSLGRRQQRNAAGERDTWGTKDWSALFNYSAEKMVDLMDIMVEEADAAGLRQLVPGGAIPRTDAERQADKRLRQGSETLADIAAQKVWDGIAALQMQDEGMTLKAIATIVGRGRTSLLEAMREAKALLDSTPTGSVSRADATEDRSAKVVRKSSRYMWSEGLREGPAPAPAPAAAPVLPSAPVGTVTVRRWTRHHATVEAATGTWCWTVAEAEGLYRHRDVYWDLDTGCTPSEADRALAEAARSDLDASLSQPVAARPSTSRRRPAAARPVASQDRRTVPMPVRRVTGDERWENSYWRASQGG